MNLKEEVEHQLRLAHRKRTRFNYLLQTLVYLVSIYAQNVFGHLCHFGYSSLGTFFLGTLFRFYSAEFLFFRRPRAFTVFNVTGYFLMALGWILHLQDVFYTFGATSQNVNYTMVVIAGVFIISSQATIASVESFYSFLTTLAVGVAGVYAFDGNSSNDYLAWSVMLFYFVTVYFFHQSHWQLKTTIELKILSQQEKKRFMTMINSIPAIITTIDKDLLYTAANTFSETIFPVRIGGRVGYQLGKHPYTDFIFDFMDSSRLRDITELAIPDAKGRVHHLMMNVAKTEDGGAIIVAVVMDELVAARAELKNQEAKAQYASKLASLGQMAAGIAHEINNPLTIIMGSASIVNRIVKETPLDVNMIQDLTEKIVLTSKRISKIIQSLKSLSRNADRDPFLKVSVSKLLDDCFNLCQQRFEQQQVKLLRPTLENDVFVKGREVQLGQVLLNLLNNACDAINGEENGWVKIEVHQQGECAIIDVQDSGPGVPVDLRVKIMEPFFTTKDINQGTGLGLSISKTIMSEHLGELTLLEGQPTTFRMRIPLAT